LKEGTLNGKVEKDSLRFWRWKIEDKDIESCVTARKLAPLPISETSFQANSEFETSQ
jgi:hypothetical protein